MADTQAGAPRRRVLIAEDEALIRLDLREMLIGARVVVRPPGPAEFPPRRVFPTRNDELRRRRLVLEKETPKTLAIDQGGASKNQPNDD